MSRKCKYNYLLRKVDRVAAILDPFQLLHSDYFGKTGKLRLSQHFSICGTTFVFN